MSSAPDPKSPFIPPCTEAEGQAFIDLLMSLPDPPGHREATYPEVAPPPAEPG